MHCLFIYIALYEVCVVSIVDMKRILTGAYIESVKLPGVFFIHLPHRDEWSTETETLSLYDSGKRFCPYCYISSIRFECLFTQLKGKT